MKAIPKYDLIAILSSRTDPILKSEIDSIFEVYGDDYFKDYGAAPYEQTRVNSKRAILIEEVTQND